MIYLDTNIIIYAIQNHPLYGKACATLLRDIERGRLKTGASSLVLLEVYGVLRKFNGTLRRKKEKEFDIQANFDALLSLPITWFDMSVYVIERSITYTESVQTGDYVHIATADIHGMREIFSADKEFDRISWIKRIDPLTY